MKKITILLFSFVLTGAIGWVGLQAMARKARASKESLLIQNLEDTARQTNLQLPQQLTEFSRLDRVEAGPGKRFTYHFTLSGAQGRMTAAEFESNLAASVKRDAANSSSLHAWFARGVVVVYRYSDDQGAFVGEVPVQAEDL